MPIILPTFEVREKLTAEKLNEMRDAIEAKFSGGITPADWVWPFVLQGNIDFADTYGILNLKTFWNLINAAEYTSLQAAIDAAQSAGGGCVVIPPDTEITTNGVNITGSLISIVGYGPSSVLKLSNGSSSGYLLRTVTGGLTDITVANLAFDGQNTGVAQAGVVARRVARFVMERVYMKNFSGPFIQITHDGAAGNACSEVEIRSVLFTGGTSAAANHLKIEDCDGLVVEGTRSESCATHAYVAEPTGAAGILRDFTINGNRIKNPTGKGISILGASATPDAKWSHFTLADNRVRGNTDDAYELGEASKILQHLDVVGCVAVTSGADAFVVNAQFGSMKGCRGYDATGDGLDLVVSERFNVSNNDFFSAGAYGIDASDTTDCILQGNDVIGAFTASINRTSSVRLRCYENPGDVGPTAGSARTDFTAYTKTNGSGTGDIGFSYVIPANTVKLGDLIRVNAHITHGGGGAGVLELRIGGTALGSINTTAAADNLLQVLIWVNQGGNSQTHVHAFRNGQVVVFGPFSGTIDWTIDRTMTFQVTTGPTVNDMVLRSVFVEFVGAAA